MDTSLLDALIAAGGLAAAGGAGAFITHKFAKPKASPRAIKTDDIPLIEIDGKLVPHPTIVARRKKQAETR